jgi:hypothetical protein
MRARSEWARRERWSNEATDEFYGNSEVCSAGDLGGTPVVTTGAQAMGDPQVRDDLFAGADKFAHGAKTSTEVNLDKRMIGMAAKFASSDDDVKGCRRTW